MSKIIMFPGVESESENNEEQVYGDIVAKYAVCCNLFSEIGELLATFFSIEQTCNKQEIATTTIEKCTHLKHLATVLADEQDNVIHIEKYMLGEDDFISALNGFIETCDVTIPALSAFINDN